MNEVDCAIIERTELLAKPQYTKMAFEEAFGIKELALFGSYARNEAKQHSDIDLLIESSRNCSLKEISKMEIIASQVLGR